MNANQFRTMVLRMQGAVEGAHMRHPDFRANGRIFATLTEDGSHGMVTLTPDQQQEFIAADARTFQPASGAWGRQGCTMVRLATADPETVGEAITLAWQNSARAVRRAAGKRRAANAAGKRKRAPR